MMSGGYAIIYSLTNQSHPPLLNTQMVPISPRSTMVSGVFITNSVNLLWMVAKSCTTLNGWLKRWKPINHGMLTIFPTYQQETIDFPMKSGGFLRQLPTSCPVNPLTSPRFSSTTSRQPGGSRFVGTPRPSSWPQHCRGWSLGDYETYDKYDMIMTSM